MGRGLADCLRCRGHGLNSQCPRDDSLVPGDLIPFLLISDDNMVYIFVHRVPNTAMQEYSYK